MDKDDVMVSVVCATYNHAKYIRDALESFLNQKTTFLYEILINDDASTDGTSDIIREYENRYPNIVKPVYQIENQYSKGIGIARDLLIPRVKGRYVAFCEGDDFWIDDRKLQKQFDYMENHRECSFCTHNAVEVNKNGEYIKDYITSEESKIIDTCEVILKGGGFCATSSIFTRTDIVQKIPRFLQYRAYDYTWQIHFASQGETFCFCDKMSAYRVETEGSWTERMKNDSQKMISHIERTINVLRFFDEDTNFKYSNCVNNSILRYEYKLYSLRGDYDKLAGKQYLFIRKELPVKQRILSTYKALAWRLKKLLRNG